ncbi:MAG: DUF3575 domain-containing protein [Saprospiraceae bacterium]|nr:DUF3575 domain-containing protein [Saprospiraceae bacterium]
MNTSRFLGLFLLLNFGAITSNLSAQVDVTASPGRLLWGSFNVGADFAVKENFSIEVNGGYNTGTVLEKLGIDDYQAVPINLIGKYYFSPRQKADGFYVDGFVRFVSRSFKADVTIDTSVNETVDFNRSRVGLGFGLGYKVVSKSGFVFDIGTGLGRTILQFDNINVSGDDYDVPNWNKTLAFVRVGIGYRFGSKRDFD